MSISQLGNCPRCGKLYLRVRDICDVCYQKQEDDYLKTAAYLRKNPGSTIQEVSDETGVAVSQIRHFILIGRIVSGHFPNLSYSCATCGSSIRSGKVCKSCLEKSNQISEKENHGESETVANRNAKNSAGYISYL